jgi:hypothetical protein
MAFSHGKLIYVTLKDGLDAVIDISAYTNKVDFPRSVDTAETTTFGLSDKTYLPGLKGATLSMEGIWDAEIDRIIDSILGIETDFQYAPQGNTAGKIMYDGAVICTSYNPPGSISDAVKWSASFIITGAVGRATI